MTYNEKKRIRNKKLVFFSKKDVEKALRSLSRIIIKPILRTILEIYNLENYLLDLEKSSLSAIQEVKFFPPYSSYKDN